MSAAIQLPMPLRAEKFCVLLTVNSVRDRLADYEFNEDDVKTMCQDHTLAPAFDIGLGGRLELRVCPSAVTFYLQTLGSRRRRVNEGEWVAEILRGFADRRLESCFQSPLPGERVRGILNCGADHINALVDAGELRVMAGTERRPGRNGCDQILRPSLKDFLKRRLV